MSDDNITLVPTAADKANEDFALIARLMKSMAEHADEIAKARWTLYKAYLSAGFDKTEALNLCARMTV